jgi:hypothetical protein
MHPAAAAPDRFTSLLLSTHAVSLVNLAGITASNLLSCGGGCISDDATLVPIAEHYLGFMITPLRQHLPAPDANSLSRHSLLRDQLLCLIV